LTHGVVVGEDIQPKQGTITHFDHTILLQTPASTETRYVTVQIPSFGNLD
jgi:hypothetical protein